MFNFFKLPNWRPTMTSAKTKNSTKHTTEKAFENRESSELRSDIENLWIGMERRKFSYTITFLKGDLTKIGRSPNNLF
jgi:hypothetical protein